ncbi:acetyltransferase [Microbacterium aerolatum]
MRPRVSSESSVADVVVVGAGGFGREALDVIEAAAGAGEGHRILGVVDQGPRAEDLGRLQRRGVDYLGTPADWLDQAEGDVRFVVAIGDPATRERVTGQFERAGFCPISVVHPSAVIGSQSLMGEGVVVASGVQVSTNVVIGDHVHLNPGSIIGHDTRLSAYVSVNPGAVISGNVLVERSSLVGAGAVVLQGLTVGSGATIGAAACVTKDVASGATVVGVPAR